MRFGLQIRPAVDDPATIGPRAEQAGFDIVTISDHVGSGRSPLATLGYVAASAPGLRIGTLVLNNDMRNPVQLAWEAATLHQLSGGRFELGLGAGHTPQEYAATGVVLDPPPVRKERLAEAVGIIRALLAGHTVDHDGRHYQLAGARLDMGPSEHDAPPILVGGNGRALLRHAAANADTIGLQGLGRTLADGHDHAVNWAPEHLDHQIATIRGTPGGERVELQALVQVVVITDDREQELRQLAATVSGLELDHARDTPFLAVGTVDEIARQLLSARDRWGLEYFTVRDLALAPVISRIRQLDGGLRSARSESPARR